MNHLTRSILVFLAVPESNGERSLGDADESEVSGISMGKEAGVLLDPLLGIVKVYNSLRAVIEYKSPVLKGINGDIISLMSILYKILECTA